LKTRIDFTFATFQTILVTALNDFLCRHRKGRGDCVQNENHHLWIKLSLKDLTGPDLLIFYGIVLKCNFLLTRILLVCVNRYWLLFKL
jgi:hypothetical protein